MSKPFELRARLDKFLNKELGHPAGASSLVPLPGDASTRQYFRLIRRLAPSLILTVYPDPFDAADFSYRAVYELFRTIGLPVPEILAIDGGLGIVLQEDLGDETLEKRLLSAPSQERHSLIRRAIDHLLLIQQQGTLALEPNHVAAQRAFDREKLLFELDFFQTHYLDGYRRSNHSHGKDLASEFEQLCSELAGLPRLLCHRDYQVRNLMLKKNTLYVTDFQDARLGPSSYDLVSLLKDSVHLPENEVDKYLDYYLSLATPSPSKSGFLREFHLMTIQRMLKALGSYGYQLTRRRKTVYSRYVRGSLQRALYALEALSQFPAIELLVKKDLAS